MPWDKFTPSFYIGVLPFGRDPLGRSPSPGSGRGSECALEMVPNAQVPVELQHEPTLHALELDLQEGVQSWSACCWLIELAKLGPGQSYHLIQELVSGLAMSVPIRTMYPRRSTFGVSWYSL